MTTRTTQGTERAVPRAPERSAPERSSTPRGGNRRAPERSGALAETDRWQLLAGEHHDPHALLEAHPEKGGVRVRALRPYARSVAVVAEPCAWSWPRKATACSPRCCAPERQGPGVPPGGRVRGHAILTADDPYRFLPTLGELDLHLIGEGRHEQLWNGARLARRADRWPACAGTVVRGVGAQRPRRSGSSATSTAGTAPRPPDALARLLRRVGAVRARRRPRGTATSTSIPHRRDGAGTA